jgi:hypothetical protein
MYPIDLLAVYSSDIPGRLIRPRALLVAVALPPLLAWAICSKAGGVAGEIDGEELKTPPTSHLS